MRVLLAEDHEELSEALSRTLTDLGHAVDPVTDGEQALGCALTGDHDILLLDLGLPVRDGFSVLKALRDQGRKLPVLVMTARDGLNDRLTGLNLGADDYLVKPFEPSELEARMRAIMRRTQGQPTALVRLGQLSFDGSSREVRLNGQLLRLSPRDFSVLEVLMRHPGRLVSKERMLGSIGSWDRDFSESALEVYVHRLRRHLAGSDVEIVNQRGFGYLIHQRNEHAGPSS